MARIFCIQTSNEVRVRQNEIIKRQLLLICISIKSQRCRTVKNGGGIERTLSIQTYPLTEKLSQKMDRMFRNNRTRTRGIS